MLTPKPRSWPKLERPLGAQRWVGGQAEQCGMQQACAGQQTAAPGEDSRTPCFSFLFP